MEEEEEEEDDEVAGSWVLLKELKNMEYEGKAAVEGVVVALILVTADEEGRMEGGSDDDDDDEDKVREGVVGMANVKCWL